MNQFHSPLAQRLDIQVAAGTAEIIEANKLECGIMLEQTVGDAAPSEAADSGEENSHFDTLIPSAARFDRRNLREIGRQIICRKGLDVHSD